MYYARRCVRICDTFVNDVIILCLVPILLFGLYGIWDSQSIYQGADATVYRSYRPSDNTTSFDELRTINPEVFSWLTIDNTHIDYPVAQTTNNEKYVNIDAKGNFSLSGCLFLDYRNKPNYSDSVNIVYGHHMDKRLMFGQLMDFANKEFFETHKTGRLFYNKKWHRLDIFALLNADAYDSVIYNPYVNRIGLTSYINHIKNFAVQFRDFEYDTNTRLLVMSTCTSLSTNGRHLLVATISNDGYEADFNSVLG